MRRLSVLALLLFAACAHQRATSDSDLHVMFEKRRFVDLRDALAKVGDDRPHTQFFRGVVSNKWFNLADSDRWLERYVATNDERYRVEALELLADNAIKSFRYGDASDAYARIRALRPGHENDADYANAQALWGALRGLPAQTIEKRADTLVHGKATGEIEMPVRVGGKELPFGLDSGANLSTTTKSIVAAMGFTPIEARIDVGNVAGAKIVASLALAPELVVAENIVVRNAVFLVFEDKDLPFIDPQSFGGLLGFPIMHGFGEIEFLSRGGVRVPARASREGAGNLFVDGLNPYAVLWRGKERVTVAVDTGAGRTYLYVPFLDRNRAEIERVGIEKKTKVTGVGSSRDVAGYELPEVVFNVGGSEATLRDVPVFSELTTNDGKYYDGNLGRDVFAGAEGLVMNFETMSLRIVR